MSATHWRHGEGDFTPCGLRRSGLVWDPELPYHAARLAREDERLERVTCEACRRRSINDASDALDLEPPPMFAPLVPQSIAPVLDDAVFTARELRLWRTLPRSLTKKS